MLTGKEMVTEMYETGMSYRGIAAATGVCTSTIASVARGSRPRQSLYDKLTALYVARMEYRKRLLASGVAESFDAARSVE